MKIYGVNIAEGSTITNLVVASGGTFPELASEGELFYRNDGANEGMYVYDGEEWIQFGTSSGIPAGALISEVSGDLTGTVEMGTTSAVYLSAVGTSGTYVTVTTDEKGRVISGTSTQAWSSITSTPTTLSGYGISDAQPLDSDLTAIAGLTATSGLLKKTAADTWSLDTNTYLTGNQSITISGDATGSGSTSISLTLANTGVSVGRFGDQSSVPVISFDSKGRATSASAVSIGIFASQITGGTLLDERVAVSNVTQHQASLTIAESQITDGVILARVGSSETISGTWSFNNPVTVATPTSGSHAATKDYVDNYITGLDMKASVRVATTANITLSGTQTIDGVALVLGNRVLVKDQTTATQNGIYVVTAGSWPRASDADNTPEGEVTSGMYTFVEEGTVNADSGWALTTNDPIALGTTGLTFVQFNGLGQITAGAGLTKTGSTIDVASASANRIVVNADSIDLATVGIPGTYTKVTTDAYGRITTATTLIAADIPNLSATYQPLDADLTAIAGLAGTSGLLKKTNADTWSLDTSTYQTGNQTIAISGDATGSGSTSISLTLSNSGVAAGTFTKVTVDAKGRVTTATTLSAGDIPNLSATYQPLDADLTAIGGLAGTSGLLKKTAADTWTLDTASYLTGNQSISITGDASGSGSTSISLTLANSGVAAGTFTKVTVDAKGRVTSATTLSAGDIPNLSSTYQPLDADLTAIGALAGTSGLLKKTAADTWALDTASYLTGNQSISITGDATGSGSTSIALTLANSGISAGAYGSASAVPVVTFDAKGRATTASSTSIAIAASQITSGTLADARVAASNVTQHQASLTIAESQITDGAILARVGSSETISGTWSFNNPVTVATPTTGLHAATKDYVDNAITGLDMKASVRVATTANITLSGTQTIDGVAVVAGNRVLVKDQTTASQNGIYVVAAGAWSRASDADNTPAGEVTSGMYAFVEEGTVNADSGWVLTTNDPIALGTTSLTFVQFNGLGQVTAGAGLTKTGNTLDIATASASRIVVNADSIDLATTGVAAGTFTKVTTDAYGRITTATTLLAADIPTLNQNTTGSAASLTTARTLTIGATGKTFNGTADVSWSRAEIQVPRTLTTTNIGIETDESCVSYVGSITLLGQTDGALYSHVYSTAWKHQIFGDYRTGQIAIRGRNNGVWQAWRTVLDSINYNSYAPTLAGDGATGTWGISITGTAATLTTGRTISMTGDVTYTSGSFNGSANVTGVATLANSGVSAGTYTKVTVDAKGRVTTATNLVAGDIPTLTGYVLKTGDTMTGTLTGTNFYAAAGTTSSPSISFAADNNTGIYNPAADTIAFVEGGVEAMRISSSGTVGINTTVPTARLEVVGGPTIARFIGGSADRFQGIAIRNNFGSATQLADVFYDVINENGAAVANMVGSIRTDGGSMWSWDTQPAGTRTDRRVTRMIIDSSGNVGIGTTTPTQPLDVNGTLRVRGSRILQDSGTANPYEIGSGAGSGDTTMWGIYAPASRGITFSAGGNEAARITSASRVLINRAGEYSNGSWGTPYFQVSNTPGTAAGAVFITTTAGDTVHIGFANANGPVGSITTFGNNTYYNATSDYRLKENIAPMSGALDKIAALKPVTYTWKSDGSTGQGFIAHELAEVMPDVVTGRKDAVSADGQPMYQAIDQSKLVALLTAAVKELKAELDSLKAQISK